MTDTAATDPAAGAPEPAPAPEVAPEAAPPEGAAPEGQEAEGQDPALGVLETGEEAESQPEPAAPEAVEVEINGRKYLVPADLRDGYMMHADYTTKTQSLAEQVRLHQEQFTQQVQAHQQHVQAHRQNLQDYGQLAHTDYLLEQYRNTDWAGVQQEDPDQAQQLGFEYQRLRDQREQIAQRIQQKEHETRAHAERETANHRGQLTATLARDIPNYSPELQGKMDETAARHGYTQAEVDSIIDPRMGQMLYLAHLGEQVVLQRQAATARPAPAPVKPVPKAGGGGTPTTGPTDKQGIDAWMHSRDQQLKRGTR